MPKLTTKRARIQRAMWNTGTDVTGGSPFNKRGVQRALSSEKIPIPRWRRYVLLKRDNHGVIWGFAERSFVMDWSKTEVAIWDYPPLHYYNPHEGHILARLNSKRCPIKVNLKEHTRKSNCRFTTQ
jgi:hypothetical protein